MQVLKTLNEIIGDTRAVPLKVFYCQENTKLFFEIHSKSEHFYHGFDWQGVPQAYPVRLGEQPRWVEATANEISQKQPTLIEMLMEQKAIMERIQGTIKDLGLRISQLDQIMRHQ